MMIGVDADYDGEESWGWEGVYADTEDDKCEWLLTMRAIMGWEGEHVWCMSGLMCDGLMLLFVFETGMHITITITITIISISTSTATNNNNMSITITNNATRTLFLTNVITPNHVLDAYAYACP